MNKYYEEYLIEVRNKLLEHNHDHEATKKWIAEFSKTHRREFIEKKLIKAENYLGRLKENNDITSIELLDKILDCIRSIKANIEIDTPKNIEL